MSDVVELADSREGVSVLLVGKVSTEELEAVTEMEDEFNEEHVVVSVIIEVLHVSELHDVVVVVITFVVRGEDEDGIDLIEVKEVAESFIKEDEVVSFDKVTEESAEIEEYVLSVDKSLDFALVVLVGKIDREVDDELKGQ